jgi:beta-phosphoglucomutase-like phosphatase (HAD superfamily)
MKNIDTYRVAIFDCDGVILDSNKIKSEAFGLTLRGEKPHLVEEFIEYHQKNGGISRYVKFTHFFKNIKRQLNYDKPLVEALELYGQLSKKGLLECPEIPGIRRILKHLNSLKIPCYVTSGGDQSEIRDIFKSRNLTTYFEGIFGSPLSKIENLAKINKKKCLPIPGVYFGDANSDLEAAKKYGLDFVYISGASEWDKGPLVCKKMNLSIYNDFNAFYRE